MNLEVFKSPDEHLKHFCNLRVVVSTLPLNLQEKAILFDCLPSSVLESQSSKLVP